MTDPEPNSISAELVMTGPADQILAAKAAILRMEQDYPGLKLSARIQTQVSSVEYIGQKPPVEMTTEEFLGYDEGGSPPPDDNRVERARNSLRRAQIETVGQLVEKTEDDLLAITNFGQKSLDLVKEKLAKLGLELKPIS
jgi:DNA-directed RNA polymerase alpha subunit